MGTRVPALCLHSFGDVLEDNTCGFHVIASSTKKKCLCHGKNQKGAQRGCLSGLFKEKMGSTGSSAQGPWASSATGRGAQTAHNLVIGRCECGDFAARE